MTGDVRIIESEIGPVIPLVDIADQLHYTSSGLRKVVGRHPGTFQAEKVFIPIPTARGPQKGWCLTRKGMEDLILLISPGSGTKAGLLEKRVEKFHMGPAVPALSSPQSDPVITYLKRNAEIADILVKGYGYTEEVAHRLAMQDAVNKHGEVLAPFKAPALLPAADPQEPVAYEHCESCLIKEEDPDFDRYFSLRKIAEITHESEDRVRNILEKEGLLSYHHGVWHLTTLGQKFGKVFTHYPLFPHRLTKKNMIRWSPAAIERVKVHLSAGQTSLVPAHG